MLYQEFINSIKESRPLNEWFEYSHRHHIIPRCVGGNDNEDNLIYLTPKEHFIAHKLLYQENPYNVKLFYAYWIMCRSKDKFCTPEEYEEASIKHSEIMKTNFNPSRNMTEETKRKISESMKGRVFTEEHKRKLSESATGRIMPKESLETRLKKSKSHEGKKWTPKQRESYENSIKRKNMVYNLICKSCGCTFHAKSPVTKFCDNCRLDVINNDFKLDNFSKSSSRLDYDKVCKRCGSKFKGGKSAKYCSACK